MTKESPSLKQLRAFFAVAKAESVTGGSLAMNLSQPAVTQSIAKLEAGLGVAVFNRTRLGSYLTEAGTILLRRVERFFNQWEAALCNPDVGAPFATAATVRSMLIKISSSQMQALIAIAESSSFNEAARRLQISQPSLQRAARELEQILQKTLYHRTSTGISATRAAQELARRLSIALREIGYAIEEIEAARGQASPRISVGALPLACLPLLACAVNDLLLEYPQAEIEIRDGRYEPLLAELRSGKIDFLYGILRCPADIGDVREMPMLRDQYRIAVRRGHPLARRPEIRVEDMANYDWILPGEGNPRRRVIEHLFGDAARKPDIRIVTSCIAAHKAILVSSDRLTLLTDSELREQAHELTALPVSGLATRRPEGVALRRDWDPTPAQHTFLKLLERHTQNWIRSRPAWFPAEPAVPEAISQNQ
jgi:LysR family transcriptional regulator of gallate degradation